MCSKVSSDWLSSYIKAMRPVLEIFKMAGYFPESPCTLDHGNINASTVKISEIHSKPLDMSTGENGDK
jgi:hypothetical protein